jgi:hypothetical protein
MKHFRRLFKRTRNKETLLELIQIAKQDYRDILCWEQVGPLTAEEGRQLQAAAKLLLDRWGKAPINQECYFRACDVC